MPGMDEARALIYLGTGDKPNSKMSYFCTENEEFKIYVVFLPMATWALNSLRSSFLNFDPHL
jgi:hypothetical protein